MDSSENDRDALFSIGIGDSVGPQSGLGQNGDPNEVDILQGLFKIDRREEIFGERDGDIPRGEGGQDGKGEIGDTGVLFNRWSDEFNLHA